MSKYFKNFIMCGDIDFFCLLCEESFQLADMVDKHIRWEKHRKALKGLEYFPKFKKELVFKIQTRYYCEACNFVAPKMDIIKNHIKTQSHITNRTTPIANLNPPIAKRETHYIKLGRSVVVLNEWHGIVHKQCVVCHETLTDIDDHAGMFMHMVNLIQAKVKSAGDDQYYRELDNETFYCFKCKKAYPNDALTDHWTSEEHTGIKTDTDTDATDIDTSRPFQYFDVDQENDTVTCRICKVTLPFTHTALYNHRNGHRVFTKEPQDEEHEEAFRLLLYPDHGKRRHELKLYGQKHYIKMTAGGAKGYCELCFTYLSAHMRIFKSHVNGARHLGFMEHKGLIKHPKLIKKQEKPKYRTKPMKKYFEDVIKLVEIDAYWLNREMCIKTWSLWLHSSVPHLKDKFRCFLCGKVCDSNDKVHSKAVHMIEEYKRVNVITSEEGFVREIKPGIYHCGFCNQIFPNWALLQAHYKSWKHKEATIEEHSMRKYALSHFLNIPPERVHLMSQMECLD